ncbi:hypothetical protein [Streptomyces lichenis]|uniref:Transposase n=1 Tax=Streptomyces lichenis TaxID=2306967 RepID=A0ABT0I580_9ACTN|nr:hypothetical protein [Streptomyces lichenis]MCK8676479.1 hypothetical protein [Streptomyces lichenis]
MAETAYGDSIYFEQLVSERRIVLPASAGHYAETGKRFSNEKRYKLALTILQQSRGWQMRDALEVRRQEIRRALLRDAGTADTQKVSAVFTSRLILSTPQPGGTRDTHLQQDCPPSTLWH